MNECRRGLGSTIQCSETMASVGDVQTRLETPPLLNTMKCCSNAETERKENNSQGDEQLNRDIQLEEAKFEVIEDCCDANNQQNTKKQISTIYHVNTHTGLQPEENPHVENHLVTESELDTENNINTANQLNTEIILSTDNMKNHLASDNKLDKDHPYKHVLDGTGGRHLVASRAVRAGELLFVESPVTLGPNAESTPICLSCHSPINAIIRCPSCQWPMCSNTCAEAIGHQAECQILSQDTKKIGVPVAYDATPRYDLILLLRCLLLKKLDPSNWEKVLKMASHWERRKREENPYLMAAVRYFSEICHVNFDVDIIHHVRGVIVTNCFETKGPQGISLRGLYPLLGRMNHSCLPTVALRADNDGKMYVRAAVDLAEGEAFTVTYSSTTEPTWNRYCYLNETYYFECQCVRCADPSEFKTNFSNPLCSICPKHFLHFKDGKYICSKCKTERNQDSVEQEAAARIEMVEQSCINTVEHKKKLLDITKKTFHQSHYVYHRVVGKILALEQGNSIQDAMLERQLWQTLLSSYNILEPGMTRRRGMTLYKAGMATERVWRLLLVKGEDENSNESNKNASFTNCPENEQNYNKCSTATPLTTNDCNRRTLLMNIKTNTNQSEVQNYPKGITKYLHECHLYLQEAAAILELEPPNSTQIKWKHRAMEEANRISVYLRNS